LRTQSKFRLLVVRLGAMGDILHALPAVTALRQAHPGWQIDWIVEPAWVPLLTAKPQSESGIQVERSPAQPLVDAIHPAAVKSWARNPLSGKTFHEISHLRRVLRMAGYDAVLDFQGAIRSALIGRLTGCRRVIGEAVPRERAAKWLFTERIETNGVHVIEQDVEVASAVAGDALQPVLPILPMDAQAEEWSDALLGTAHNAGRDRTAQSIALLNPGAGWGAKRWPVERYAAVAHGLAERGFFVVVNAGPGEVELANAVHLQSGGVALPAACSLIQFIALTRRVNLVIAGDTGPLHLACALGKPVVGIFGPTDPARNGPFGTRFRVLRSAVSRRDHTRREEPEAGLLTIQPADVLQATDELQAEEAVR
jgi:heptosyltransferase I